MSNFINVLKESTQTYKYRIRTIVDLDKALDDLKFYLTRHHLSTISEPETVMFQSNPLFFPNVENEQIYLVDFELSVPINPDTLQKAITGDMGLSNGMLPVFGENNPFESNAELIDQAASIKDKANGLEQASLLCTNSEYKDIEHVDSSEFYGERSISNVLNKAKEDKQSEIVKTNELSIFGWLDDDKLDKKEEQAYYDGKVSRFGNILDSIELKKDYVDGDEVITLSGK